MTDPTTFVTGHLKSGNVANLRRRGGTEVRDQNVILILLLYILFRRLLKKIYKWNFDSFSTYIYIIYSYVCSV